MRMRILRTLTLALAVGIFAGCAWTGAYNPSYLAAARRPATATVDGRVLVVTSAQDDAYSFTGAPTSFSGGGTKLTMPLGAIVREAAIAAFADTFKGGAEAAATITNGERYALIVEPRLLSYSYEYNQLKNVGFAITPTAVVSVDVRVVDAAGVTRWQRQYAPGPVEGPAYILNTSPQDEISKVTHKALYDVFAKAAADIVREQIVLVPFAAVP